jgi:hypothetical protein
MIYTQTYIDTLRNLCADLKEALQALLDFAETYGPSKRATAEDWSDYFTAAREAIAKAEKHLP